MLNISRIKGNQTMKFGQLIEHHKSGKSKWSAAWFHYILIALKLAYNPEIGSILIF